MDNQNPESQRPELPAPSQPATRPEPATYYEPPRRNERKGPPVVGPVVLIGLGLLFLGHNLGLVPLSTLQEAWRLWPLLLVLAGIEIVIGRTNWGATVGAVFVAVAVLAFFGTMSYFVPWAPRATAGERAVEFQTVGASSAERVVEDLGGAQQAVIDLRHGAGRVFVSALAADSDKLIDADLAHGQYSAIERSIDRQGNRVFVNLRNRMERNVVNLGGRVSEDWYIKLSPAIPTELTVQSGASELNLDLSGLLVTRLDVQAGASGINVTLPAAAGHTSAFIKAGAAGVDVRVPEGVGARVSVKGGLSGTDVDGSRFRKVGSDYETADYRTAQNRVELQIETGISGVTVR
jgi:hypothetical protein